MVSDPDPVWIQDFDDQKNWKKIIPGHSERTSKLQEKPSALRREHQALQNMKFLYFISFLLLWVIFALLNPDPDSETPK